MGAEHPFTPYTTLKDENFNTRTYDASVFELSFLNQSRFTKLLPDLYKYKIKSKKKNKKHKKSLSTIPKNKGIRLKHGTHINYDEEYKEEEEPSYHRQMKPTTYDITVSHHTSTTPEENLLSKTTLQFTESETSPPETKYFEVTTPKTTTTEVITIETTVVETTTAISQTPTISTLPAEITETMTEIPDTVTVSDEFLMDLSTQTGSERVGNTVMVNDFDTTDTEVDTTIETTEFTTRKSNKSAELDIPRLLEIIAGLAGEFETNLTRKLNETLLNMSIPTCTTPTTMPPVTSEYDANYTGATIAKVI